MILKVNTEFKHGGYTFKKGVVYDVNINDAKYFLGTKWMGKSKRKRGVVVGELGYDPDTRWGTTGKKVMSN